MSTVTLPLGHYPISYTEINGAKFPSYIDQDWMRALDQLLTRVGGVTSNTITEINIAAFEDAGIAEQQAELHALEARFGQLPPMVSVTDQIIEQVPQFHVTQEPAGPDGLAELQARVTTLETAVAGLMQGVLK